MTSQSHLVDVILHDYSYITSINPRFRTSGHDLIMSISTNASSLSSSLPQYRCWSITWKTLLDCTSFIFYLPFLMPLQLTCVSTFRKALIFRHRLFGEPQGHMYSTACYKAKMFVIFGTLGKVVNTWNSDDISALYRVYTEVKDISIICQMFPRYHDMLICALASWIRCAIFSDRTRIEHANGLGWLCRRTMSAKMLIVW